MTPTLRQRLLVAVGIFAGLLASFNLFAQNPSTHAVSQRYAIGSQEEYVQVVESIQDLAVKLYFAHQEYPQLMYSQVYNADGSIMGFNVTGVPKSTEADKIASLLLQLELLGNAVNTMDSAYLPESKNEKLSSRVSKKQATKGLVDKKTEIVLHASSANPNDLIASNR